MNRLCIFGGSFNPPHKGHVAAAAFVLRALQPDRLLWVPAGAPPHKTLPPGSPTAEQRLAMSRLAVRELPDTQVCDIEITEDLCYTADTAARVTALYHPKALWLVLGGDMLLSLDSWFEAGRLLSLCSVAALTRTDGQARGLEDKARRLRRLYGSEIRVLANPVREISSTQLRAMLPKGEGAEHLPPGVYEYIQKEKLYGIG